MTIRARLNAKGAVAAPGAAQVLGPNVTLHEAGRLELDFSGFAAHGGASFAVGAVEGLGVEDLGQGDGVWTLMLSGAGSVSLSISTHTGKNWSGRVVVR